MGIHYDASANRLLVLMDLAVMRIQMYNNPGSIPAGVVTANAVLNITDRPNKTKSRLHGLTYSGKLFTLIVTETDEAAAPVIPYLTKPSFKADGGIYINTGAAAKLSSGRNFASDRVIYGSNTRLGKTLDVVIDDRDNKSLVYSGEKANKRILVFKISDTGNVSPTISLSTTEAPEPICLHIK